VGALGLIQKQPDPLFITLIPFIILISIAVMLTTFRNWDMRFIYYLVFLLFAGYAVEYYGVSTKKLFGDYSYGDALGWKVGGVPLIMSFMWFMLIISAGFTIRTFKSNAIIRSLIGAGALMLLDMIIEPFAVHFGLWEWKTENGLPPNQNFYAWFLLSFGFLLLFNLIRVKLRSDMGILVFLLNIAFFLFFVLFSRY